MDNEVILVINDIELRFKLKSQDIVGLEKKMGKNIFQIFQTMSFSNMCELFYVSWVNKSVTNLDEYGLMDLLLSQYSLVELSNGLLQDIAVISGIVKKKELEENEQDESLEEIKND